MQGALRRFPLGRKGRRLETWFLIDEEAETALQVTGSSVRYALAQQGIIDPSVETAVGMLLLGDVETLVRLTLSRAVRPEYADRLSPGTVGALVSEPMVVESGNFAGWIVAGFRETELKIAGLDSVEARHTVYGGVVIGGKPDVNDSLPFGAGDPRVWSMELPEEALERPLDGPVTGLQYARDGFGSLETFVPHPAILAAGQLRPTTFDRGLTLVDPHGEPAVVCRLWRRRLIGDEYLEDRAHRTDGIDMLIRRDIFDDAVSTAPSVPKLVTIVVEEQGS